MKCIIQSLRMRVHKWSLELIKERIRKCYVFVLLIHFFTACTINNSEYTYSITNPKKGWLYYTDNPILFSVNVKTNNIEWSSSLDGTIGKGNQISCTLSEGKHTISATMNNSIIFVNDIQVLNRFNSNDVFVYKINRCEQNIYLQEGTYQPVIFSLKGSSKGTDFFINKERTVIKKAKKSNQKEIIKDFSISKNVSNLNLIKTKKKSRNIFNEEEKEREFFVLNTNNQLEKPHRILSKLISSGKNYMLWAPVDIELDFVAINQLINNFEQIIYPRTKEIFGEWADIDLDGKISILLSPSLNDEKKAIGYFNPVDLFERNIDMNSDSYNPYSNEMDIVYLAVPSSDERGSFGINSVSATLAHELTHCITFNQKTYLHILDGDEEREQEELFLDEGLSHLSENLCGFGISGGNILFLLEFLNNTSLISFCKEDAYGNEDTTGRRGAMLLFLSWLYDQSEDGRAFLGKILKSENYGWECIGEAFGKNTDDLFKEFIKDILYSYKINKKNQYPTDEITGEPVLFFCNMGDFLYNGKDINIGFPKINDSNNNNILPYSFFFTKEMMCSKNNTVQITSNDINDSFYLATTFIN